MEARARRSCPAVALIGGLLTPICVNASRVTHVSPWFSFTKSKHLPPLSFTTKTVSGPDQMPKFALGVSGCRVAPIFGRDARGVHSKIPSKSLLLPYQVLNPSGC